MVFVKVASTNVLKPGEKMGFQGNGKAILIVNLNNKYFAIGNICTHMGCRLSDGKVKDESIQCRCHGSIFDIKTGKVLGNPAKKPEDVFEVKVEGEQILVDM